MVSDDGSDVSVASSRHTANKMRMQRYDIRTTRYRCRQLPKVRGGVCCGNFFECEKGQSRINRSNDTSGWSVRSCSMRSERCARAGR